jgi:hypothetical protein
VGERSGIAATHSHTASMRLKSHGRLCHRQDNTAAILRGRWGRRHDTAHGAADTAHQGAKAGLDEAAAEEGEECAECSVGEEGEGEGEEM